MTWRVLISCPNMLQTIDEYREDLRDAGLEIDTPEISQQLYEDDLLPIIGRYDGIIAGDDELTRPVIEHAERLRVISKWGVGMDNIDHDAAAERGVTVTNTPDVFGNEVADVAVGYLVLLARRLHEIDRRVRAGEWFKPVGTSLAGATLGVIGLGSIGGELVRRAVSMRMRVLGADPSEAARTRAVAHGAETEDVKVVLRESEFVTLCCPLTPATEHLLDADNLRTTPTGVRIVNVSRGPLIDTDALVAALRDGHVAGAALDVFEDEPLPLDHELLEIDNVIVGSHNASNTAEAVRRVNELAIQNLLAGLEG